MSKNETTDDDFKVLHTERERLQRGIDRAERLALTSKFAGTWRYMAAQLRARLALLDADG